MNEGIIQDPKTSTKHLVTSNNARYYPINFVYKNINYNYQIKAYPTSDWGKDRRLIVNSSDPIFKDRSEGDFLCFCFEEKIDGDSIVISELVKKDSPLYHLINDNYNASKGYVLKDPTDKNLIDKIFNKTIEKNIPLNQILYGPPGTGKTYSTITKALNILGLLEKKDNYSKEEYEKAQEIFQNELGKRIEFVTMHQSFSYEDFVQGLKPKPDADKGISFYYKNGVFKEICRRAEESALLINRSGKEEIFLIDKLFPSFFLSIDEKSVIEILSKKEYQGKKITQKNAFEYFNGKLGKKYCKAWRDKFDYVLGEKSPRVGFQPDKFSEGELDEFRDYARIFEELTQEERKEKLIDEWILEKPKTIIPKNDSDNFVIILDEINRANISRVFGELIALVEKDKRDGKLTVTLPSGDAFTVPSNLYIIGTMNTADKSIALVDIALRRRFKFIPLYPDVERLKSVLEENNFDSIGPKEIESRVNLLKNLNKIIRAKKSVDFEIGHSYFMENDTLVNILNDQILPLLNEYFMYDLRKVKDIIENTQKDKEGNNIPKLGIKLNNQVWNDRGLLEIVSVDSVVEQIEAEDSYDSSELNKDHSNF
jgi:5-methylcytosine-specific restriction protein B